MNADVQHSAQSRRRARVLAGLGAAVRALRNERGLTMKNLAKAAGVSVRFLVQLEAGDGNISVARLEDVADALGTTGASLLTARAPGDHTPEKPIVALVGLRGAGKSSIGAAVAKKLGCPFVELDEEIVKEAQMTLSALFEIHGEAYYRTMERAVLRKILEANKPVVIATGGSLVTDPETWGLLRSRAFTVWLKASPREHWDRVVAQGDVRPMRGRPRAMNELKQLLSVRSPLYEQASLTVNTSKTTPSEIVEKLARAPRD